MVQSPPTTFSQKTEWIYSGGHTHMLTYLLTCPRPTRLPPSPTSRKFHSVDNKWPAAKCRHRLRKTSPVSRQDDAKSANNGARSRARIDRQRRVPLVRAISENYGDCRLPSIWLSGQDGARRQHAIRRGQNRQRRSELGAAGPVVNALL